MEKSSGTLIKFFGAFPFDRGGKARWLLEEMGVSYENSWLDVDQGEHESELYLQVNPLGRVPAMQINGQSMIESGAIVAFLADHFLEKAFAPPLDSPERMLYQQWMYFAASTIDPLQSRIMVVEDIPPGEIFTQKETALLSEAKDAFQFLDQALTKNPFLLKSGFSAADICVSYHLYFLQLWPEFKNLIDECKHLARYLELLRDRPAAIRSKVFTYEAE